MNAQERITTHPAQATLRAYLAHRHHDSAPPPKPEDIRRELGWQLLPNNERSVARGDK